MAITIKIKTIYLMLRNETGIHFNISYSAF